MESLKQEISNILEDEEKEETEPDKGGGADPTGRSLTEELDELKKEVPLQDRETIINLLESDSKLALEKQEIIDDFQETFGNIPDSDFRKLKIMLFLSENLGIQIPRQVVEAEIDNQIE
tara:strand:- start:192 stop:548 length:357 start_codon:yes stop_codon:yes gene_type:complete